MGSSSGVVSASAGGSFDRLRYMGFGTCMCSLELVVSGMKVIISGEQKKSGSRPFWGSVPCIFSDLNCKYPGLIAFTRSARVGLSIINIGVA